MTKFFLKFYFYFKYFKLADKVQQSILFARSILFAWPDHVDGGAAMFWANFKKIVSLEPHLKNVGKFYVYNCSLEMFLVLCK